MSNRQRASRQRTASTPTVYVIAGPNGAGKTTFASTFLPDFVKCREFLNADLIAAGLSPFAPETQDLRAGRLLLERIRELSRQKASFGFETTLAGRSYAKLLTDLKTVGYRCVLIFLWLPNVEFALQRVANRVAQGGHRIPADVVRRRYDAGLRNLARLYRPVFDEWHLYDGQQMPPKLVAQQVQDTLDQIEETLYRKISLQLEAASEKAP